MIQCSDLSISYSGSLLFTDASFSINTRERVGLVGRNGSGKTTLLRLLTGEEKADAGSIRMPKGYRLGYLSQHIAFSCVTVLDEACLGLPPEERENVFKAEAILFGLGFTHDMVTSPVSILSGGYQLRLHLAKVLLSEPDCLLLDEPTNYLDILSLRFLSRFLQKWKNELILISHDREFMDSITTHTLGIHRNRIKKVQGSSVDFFSLIALEEEQHEKERETQEKRREHMQLFVDRLGAKATKAAQARSRKKMIEKIPSLEVLKNIACLDFSFREAPFHGEKLLDMQAVSFSYQRNAPLIRDVSLTLMKRSRVAIIGKNGNGKSTLLALLAGELRPETGIIRYSDHAALGYFGQTNIERLNREKTVEEEIASAQPELSYAAVKQIAATMMFRGTHSEKRISVLSGGEKSRVLIGKILAKPCNLLLLDEPTHHLDIESIEALIDALEEFEGAVVIVTHSELLLKRLQLDALIICHKERQEYFLGSYEEFLEKKGFEEEGVAKEEIKTASRNEDRKARAERTRERAKLLAPLKRQLEKLEQQITTLEAQQKEDHERIAQASQEGYSSSLQELLRQTGLRKKEIESLFDTYVELTSRYEESKGSQPPLYSNP